MKSDDQANNLIEIQKRLTLIENLISLEEEDSILLQLEKLNNLKIDKEIEKIIENIKQQSYGEAIQLIEEYLDKSHQLSTYIDPEVEALRFEAKVLEKKIQNLSIEKSELDKNIHEFSLRHNMELGELILKILSYRKEKLTGTSGFQEAEKDYNEFHSNFEVSKDKEIAIITQEESKELKEVYRKATKLCHPDIVEKEQQEEAHKIFIELKEAYENNDLNRVKEICEDLLHNRIFTSKSDTTDEKSILQAEIDRLRLRFSEIKTEIKTIKESDAYFTISGIKDWDIYFSETKRQLQTQLDELEDE